MSHARRVFGLALVATMFILSFVGSLAAQPDPTQRTPGQVAGQAAQAVPVAANNYALFLRKDKRVTSVTVKVDRLGNRHAAYVVAAPFEENPPTVYAFCAAQAPCDDPVSWQSIEIPFGDFKLPTVEVQLQLTPQNQPRLLVRTAYAYLTSSVRMAYYFAECNTGCINTGNWNVGFAYGTRETAVVDYEDMNQPQRNFALDPQGRPRSIYYDRDYHRDPDHWGGFYTWCDADCTNWKNWRETWLLRGAIYEYPSLTFTKDGNPRIVSQIYSSGDTQGVYYLECNGVCDDLNDWSIVKIATRGAQVAPSWDIELDERDRPRIAMYRGGDLDHTKGERLLYLECNSACHQSQNWTTTDLGMPNGDGQDPDLEIDKQDRLRIAWTGSFGGVGFSYCNLPCNEPTAWNNLYFQEEVDAKWRQELPQALPLNCTTDVWKAKNTVLSLDDVDTLNIAFDVEVNARCVEQTPGDPTPYIRYRRVWDSVRLIAYPLNGGVEESPATATATTEATDEVTNAPTTTTAAPTTAIATATATGVARTASVPTVTNTPTGTTSQATPTNTPTIDTDPEPQNVYRVFLPAVRR